MTKKEKEEQGIKVAEEVFQGYVYARVFNGIRVTGNPYGGKYATQRGISLLLGKKKIGEVLCGYATVKDEAMFDKLRSLIEEYLKEGKNGTDGGITELAYVKAALLLWQELLLRAESLAPNMPYDFSTLKREILLGLKETNKISSFVYNSTMRHSRCPLCAYYASCSDCILKKCTGKSCMTSGAPYAKLLTAIDFWDLGACAEEESRGLKEDIVKYMGDIVSILQSRKTELEAGGGEDDKNA